eukprot:613204-Pelagomonas_calceolata.AAC.1
MLLRWSSSLCLGELGSYRGTAAGEGPPCGTRTLCQGPPQSSSLGRPVSAAPTNSEVCDHLGGSQIPATFVLACTWSPQKTELAKATNATLLFLRAGGRAEQQGGDGKVFVCFRWHTICRGMRREEELFVFGTRRRRRLASASKRNKCL